jgi:hypothetical protein
VITKCCTAVKTLEICSNRDLTDISMVLLVESCLQLESLTYLQLQLYRYSSFMRFLEICPRLTSLNLSNNYLTDAILCSIALSCSGLLDFDISNSKALTEVSLLKTFNISCNEKLTNESLFSVAEGCRQLQIFNISKCYRMLLKTESMLHISRLLIKLQMLNYDGLRIPAIADVRSLLENWQSLKSLTLEVNNDSRNYRIKLREYFPNIYFTFQVNHTLDVYV